jgi:DNA polymerase V
VYVGAKGSFADLGREIRGRVLKHTGIPVSVGMAETKTLAKVANYHAKRSEKAAGVLSLVRSTYKDLALARLPVDEVWGVGPRYTEMLRRRGIETALDLRDAPDDWVRERMTVVGLRTVTELRGIPCIPLEITPPNKKLITVSRSFGAATASLDELRAAIAFYTARAAEKLRRQKLAAGAVTVFIETDRFKPGPQYSNSVTLNVAPKSDNTWEYCKMYGCSPRNGPAKAPPRCKRAGRDVAMSVGFLAGWLVSVIYPPQPENPATAPTNPTPHPA